MECKERDQYRHIENSVFNESADENFTPARKSFQNCGENRSWSQWVARWDHATIMPSSKGRLKNLLEESREKCYGKIPMGAMFKYCRRKILAWKPRHPRKLFRKRASAKEAAKNWQSIFMISHKTSLKLRSIKRNPRSSLSRELKGKSKPSDTRWRLRPLKGQVQLISPAEKKSLSMKKSWSNHKNL